MALVYNTISASDAITQICSPDITDSNAIFGGHIKSWNGTDFDVPTIDEMAEEFSISGSFVGTFYADGPRMFVALGPNVMTDRLPVGTCLSLTIGAVKYFAFVHSYGIHLTGPASYYPIIILLTYDDGWTDEQELTVSDIRIGGYNKFQSLTLLDKFNSATGFGVGSRRVVKMLNGEYDDAPSQTFVGTSVYGLDKNKRQKRFRIDKKESDYPIVYYGSRATLASTPNTRQLLYGDGTVLAGFKAVVHNTTSAAINPVAATQFDNMIDLDVFAYETINYSVGPYSTNSGKLGNLIWKNVGAQKLEFNDYTFNLGDVKAFGGDFGIVLEMNASCSCSIDNLITQSSSIGISLEDKSANRTLRIKNLISTPTDDALTYLIRIYGSTTLSKIQIDTAIVTDISTALVSISSGSTYKGKIHIKKLAVQNVADLSADTVTYDELYVIPDNEKIFLDIDHEDYRIVHPILLRNGIGVNTELPESIIRLGDKY